MKMPLGFVLKTLRNASGIKQKELAKQLDITATYLSLIESDRKKPSFVLLNKMADAFNVPVEYIMVLQPQDNDQSGQLGEVLEKVQDLHLFALSNLAKANVKGGVL